MGGTPNRFIQSGFGPPVDLSAVDPDLTGGGTYDAILTATGPGIFKGASICITSGPTTAARINFFWNDKNVGSVEIPAGEDPFEPVFAPNGGELDLDTSDTIKAAFDAGAMTATVRPIGGYT